MRDPMKTKTPLQDGREVRQQVARATQDLHRAAVGCGLPGSGGYEVEATIIACETSAAKTAATHIASERTTEARIHVRRI